MGLTGVSRKDQVRPVGVQRRDDPGGLHGGGCLEPSEHPRCAGGWAEDAQQPGAEGRPQRGEAGSGVDRSARMGNSGPHLGAPGAQVKLGQEPRPPARPGPASGAPHAAPGSPPPGDFGASAERKRGAAPARERRGRGLAAAGGSAGSVPPAFVLAAARGARPGR